MYLQAIRVKLPKTMLLRFFKITACCLLLAMSTALVAEAFVCPEAKAENPPAECCEQCCPRHHLVPLAAPLENSLPQDFSENPRVLAMSPIAFLVLDPIFHPPKMIHS